MGNHPGKTAGQLREQFFYLYFQTVPALFFLCFEIAETASSYFTLEQVHINNFFLIHAFTSLCLIYMLDILKKYRMISHPVCSQSNIEVHNIPY